MAYKTLTDYYIDIVKESAASFNEKEIKEESLKEATDLFDADGIKVTRFSLGKGRVGIQISLSGKGTDNNFIKFDGEKLGKLQKALQVAQKRVKGR